MTCDRTCVGTNLDNLNLEESMGTEAFKASMIKPFVQFLGKAFREYSIFPTE